MNKNLYAYEVTEGDLKHQNTDRLVGIIDGMREKGSYFRGSLQIFCSVYDDIPDELDTIPRFRRFIRKVVSLRPYLLYYLNLKFEVPTHILGCLGDVEHTVFGEQLSDKQIREQGVVPSKLRSRIIFDDEMYFKMKNAIVKLCEEIHDENALEELLTVLEYHRNPES